MSSYTKDNESSIKLTDEEILELQNPREEESFEKFYPGLNVEESLNLITFSKPEVYSPIFNNSVGLTDYLAKQERVDTVRQDRIKVPSFRKINKSSPTILDNIDNRPPDLNSHPILKKLGFFNITNEKRLLPNEYFRPDITRDGLIRGKLLCNMKHFQVHYDMDETDLMFLEWLNKHPQSPIKISMEQFEIIITFFESKIYQIEKLLPPTIKDRSVIDYQQQQRAFLYGSDDGTGCDDDQSCAVCGSFDSDNTNAIIFCDGCDIAVHQDCYGVSFIPEGPWLCRRCLISRNNSASCIFCPSVTGAFKQTDSGDWAHVLCTLWTPELYFANPIYMEPIEGISSIPKSRWRLICYICKQKVGICIQCSKSTCFNAYHVTCAKRAGLYMKMKKGVKAACNDKSTLISYCDKHIPIEWGMSHDVKSGISKTKLYFHDKNQNHLKNTNSDTLVTQQEYTELMKTKSEKFKWRFDSNAYVIPEIIIDELCKFNDINKLPQISKLVLYQIAKYFTLKRQHLGKPLIKKPDVFNYASMNEVEIDDRNEAVEFFKQDVKKLLELLKLIEKRSKTTKALFEEQLETSKILFEPMKWLSSNLLSFFKNHYNGDLNKLAIPKYSVKPNINQIYDKCENNEYLHIDNLIGDIEKFSDWLLNLKLNSNASLLELQKTFKQWQRYKKAKYSNAIEYYTLLTDSKNIEFLKGNIEFDNQLNFSLVKNDTNNIKKRNRKKTVDIGTGKMRRLGIDINASDLEINKTRNLRARKTDVNGGVLKARLHRVRQRANIQTVRKNRKRG